MPVVIREIVSEVVVADQEERRGPPSTPALDPAIVERIVRQATERVLEVLRREWEH